MFRFNVPGKGIFMFNRIRKREKLWKKMVFGKNLSQGFVLY